MSDRTAIDALALLVDAYDRIKQLLEEHGCSCECSHHEDAAEEWEDHEDCNPCLACLISASIVPLGAVSLAAATLVENAGAK